MTEVTDAFATRRVLLRAGALAPIAALSGCGFFDTLFSSATKKKLPGKREDVLPVTEGLEPPHGIHPTVTLPPPVASNWALEGGAATHVAGNQALPDSIKEAWSAKIGIGSAYRRQVTTSPIVVGGVVFTMDSAARVSAFSAETGDRLWDLDTKPKKSRTTNIGGGIGFAGGTLYATTGYSQLLAIDPKTGKPRFIHTFNVPIRSAPTPVGGLVYFVTIDEVLVAASTEDGHQVWSYEATAADTTLLGHPAPAVGDGFVLAGFGSGDLVACDALSGAVAWSDSIAATAGQAGVAQIAAISGQPIILDGMAIAIGTGGLMVGEDLRAGRRLWERQVSGHLNPIAAGDFVFLTSNEQVAAALVARTGEIAWISELPQYKRPKTHGVPLTWTGSVLANGNLIYTGLQNELVLLDATTGKVGAFMHLPGPVSVPPIVGENTLYLITDDGKLRAYR
jgi:outer membrane protein assembly factor BamB